MAINSVQAFIDAIDEPEGPRPEERRANPLEEPVQWGAPTSLEAQDAGSRLGITTGEPKMGAFLEPHGHAVVKEAALGAVMGKVLPWIARMGAKAIGGAAKGMKGVGKATIQGLRAGRKPGQAIQKGLARRAVGSDAGEAAVQAEMRRRGRSAARNIAGESAFMAGDTAYTAKTYGR